MSYSFSVTANTKTEAKQKIAAEFDNVVNGQPSHAADRDVAVAAGQAFVDVLRDPEIAEEIYVSMYGSLSWSNLSGANAFTSGNVSASVSIREKAKS